MELGSEGLGNGFRVTIMLFIQSRTLKQSNGDGKRARAARDGYLDGALSVPRGSCARAACDRLVVAPRRTVVAAKREVVHAPLTIRLESRVRNEKEGHQEGEMMCESSEGNGGR